MSPTPCHIIAGPLGVGKTTSILHLLENAEANQRIAVIVNDFGKAGLDGDILKAKSPDVDIRSIPGGCLCCVAADKIGDALKAVMETGDIDRVLIEPSGLVILPDFIPLLRGYCEDLGMKLQPVIVILNPKRVRQKHIEQLPFFKSLVEYADILVANRADDCDEEALAHFREWSSQLSLAPLRILETQFGKLPQNVLSIEHDASPVASEPSEDSHHHEHHEHSGGLLLDNMHPIDENAFRQYMQRWLRQGCQGAQFLRFKAVLPTTNVWCLFEIAEGSISVQEMPTATRAKMDWITDKPLEDSAMLEVLTACRVR